MTLANIPARGAKVRNRRTDEIATVVGDPSIVGMEPRVPVIYDETPEDGVYWVGPANLVSQGEA